MFSLTAMRKPLQARFHEPEKSWLSRTHLVDEITSLEDGVRQHHRLAKKRFHRYSEKVRMVRRESCAFVPKYARICQDLNVFSLIPLACQACRVCQEDHPKRLDYPWSLGVSEIPSLKPLLLLYSSLPPHPLHRSRNIR